MYSSTTFSACLALVLLAGYVVGKAQPIKRVLVGGPETSRGLDLDHLPINVAVAPGTRIIFTCWSHPDSESPRIQWYEFAYNPNGNLISDGTFLLPFHPQAHRYNLTIDDPNQYDLVIKAADLTDGGVYSCSDANAPLIQKQRHAAHLTIIGGAQNCTGNIPNNGFLMEGQYYTVECTVDYQGTISPHMYWFGPLPFGQAQSDTGRRIWSGLAFYAHRTMSGQQWQSQLNFTNNFLPQPIDTATNIPDYLDIEGTARVVVQWSPQNMYADPVKPLNEYQVGDTIICYADAYPSASYMWHNTRTNERIYDSVLVIPAHWETFEQQMRCEATNLINGLPYTQDLFITIIVPGPTTTTTPSTPPTTTTPPPVSSCLDLTGRWESTFPLNAHMCIEVDNSNGEVHGVLRNHTDTFWVDLVGLTTVPDYDHTSFTSIWPLNRRVMSIVGECSRCFGTEHLIMSAISRTKGGPPCATPGDIFYSQEFHFYRNNRVICPPISIPSFGK